MLSFTFSIKKIFTCLYYTVKNQNSSCRITEKQLYRTFGFSCFTAYSFVVENIGFGNIVSSDRIIAIVSPESAPIKRLVQDSKDQGRAIDATCGRRTRAVIIMDSNHVVLSAVQPETVAGRFEDDSNKIENE